MACWQIPEEQQSELLAPETPATFELWPDNKVAVDWWLQVSDLMRWNGSACLGLDVVAVQANCQLSGCQPPAEVYQQLRLFARCVAEEFNYRAKRIKPNT